jgi:thioredoxin-related protein
MKAFPLYILVLVLAVTSSCSRDNHDNLPLDKNIKQVIFFSEENQYEHEAAYYDALIELKKEYPNEMENLMVLSEKEYFDDFDIPSGPALIVIYKEEIMVKINGDVSKDQIFKPVSQAFSTSKPLKIN